MSYRHEAILRDGTYVVMRELSRADEAHVRGLTDNDLHWLDDSQIAVGVFCRRGGMDRMRLRT